MMVSQTDLGSSKDCGVIVYTILNNCELDGIWTSPQKEYYGKIGTERAHKRIETSTETSTQPDKLSGDYDLTIWDDKNCQINSGILKIVEVKLKPENPVDFTYVLIWITVENEEKKEAAIEAINKAIKEVTINPGIDAIINAIKAAPIIKATKKGFVGVGIKMGFQIEWVKVTHLLVFPD